MKLSKKASGAFDKILNVGVALSVVSLIFMVSAVTCEIITRYFLNRPISWILETTEVSIAYFTFLAAAWVLKEEGRVKVDLVVSRLRPRAQAIIDIITSSISAILCLIVTVYAVLTTWNYAQRGITDAESILRLPSALLVGVVAIGCLLLFVQLTRRILGQIRQSKHSGETIGI